MFLDKKVDSFASIEMVEHILTRLKNEDETYTGLNNCKIAEMLDDDCVWLFSHFMKDRPNEDVARFLPYARGAGAHDCVKYILSRCG